MAVIAGAFPLESDFVSFGDASTGTNKGPENDMGRARRAGKGFRVSAATGTAFGSKEFCSLAIAGFFLSLFAVWSKSVRVDFASVAEAVCSVDGANKDDLLCCGFFSSGDRF